LIYEEEDLETAGSILTVGYKMNDFNVDDKIIYYISSPDSTEDFIMNRELSQLYGLIINSSF